MDTEEKDHFSGFDHDFVFPSGDKVPHHDDCSTKKHPIEKNQNKVLPFNSKGTNLLYNRQLNNCLFYPIFLPFPVMLPQHGNFWDLKRTGKDSILSYEGKIFKTQFYDLFLDQKQYKNKFDKKYVKDIFNFIAPKIGLKPMSRIEYRSINVFFNEKAKNSRKIIEYIKSHKTDIVEELGFQTVLDSFDAQHFDNIP